MRRHDVWIALLAIFCPIPHAFATDFDLYFLGGQSNMEGFGTVDELPQELQGSLDGVFIFQSTPMADQTDASGDGNWSVFRPGHGTGFVFVDGRNVYSNRFGLEVSLAHALKSASPDRKIAIIKYARNGSSIAIDAAGPWGCWDPDFQATEGDHRDINQYDHFLATMRQALADRDIDGDGEEDRLIPRGIGWMQGESDAGNGLEIAEKYQANLKRLMDLIRAAMHADDLPVVIGRISDSGNRESGKVWQHGEAVRTAQQQFVNQDVSAAIVTSTDEYDYSDRWHYDSKGYIDLGRRFADAFASLMK